MSKFIIYSSKDRSLEKLGNRNKILFWLIFLVFSLAGAIIPLTEDFFTNNFGNLIFISYLGLIVLLVLFAILFSKKLKKIGEIEFTKSGAIKRIGDFIETWNYDSVKKISVTKHMKEIFSLTNHERSKTYLLSTEFSNDNKIERIVLGSQSVDKPEASLQDILKLLSKVNKIELYVK